MKLIFSNSHISTDLRLKNYVIRYINIPLISFLLYRSLRCIWNCCFTKVLIFPDKTQHKKDGGARDRLARVIDLYISGSRETRRAKATRSCNKRLERIPVQYSRHTSLLPIYGINKQNKGVLIKINTGISSQFLDII